MCVWYQEIVCSSLEYIHSSNESSQNLVSEESAGGSLSLFKSFYFLIFWEREESVWAGGGAEGERESQVGSLVSGWDPNVEY